MRNFLLKMMTAVMAVTLLADMSGVADAKHRYKRHHVHQHHKKLAKRHKKPALPPIVIAEIDVSSQSMNVTVNGSFYATWRVSTARAGFSTPRGTFSVQRMAKEYYSKKYDNSPMPNSVFFSGGNAVHGSYHIKQLGRPASHGCVRLAPNNAANLYSLVKQYGSSRARIVVHQ